MHALGLTLPPISEREQPLRRGHVVVPESNRRWATDLTTTWTARDGTTHILMERNELLERLASLIPPPRAHQVRYHGLCSAEHKP
jgi:hypothetical protein